jgi:hypothetical protein
VSSNAAADLYSSFDVDDFVAVPHRENDVEVLDVAVRLKRGSPRNGGKKFAFAEGKGGLRTRLGEVTPKIYSFVAGRLRAVRRRSRRMVRQASGPWYYQKLAEIYMLGQELGGTRGKQLQRLANEMLKAARNGEIATVVAKSNVELDRRFIDNTDQVVAWFKSPERNWDTSQPFPVLGAEGS